MDTPIERTWTPGPRAALVLAVWIGLVTGLAEGPLVALKRTLFQPITFEGPSLYWTSPLAHAALFGIVGLILAGLVRLGPPARTSRVVAFVLVFLAAWSGLMVFRRQIHQVAVLLVAAGVAAQATRLLARNAAAADRLARRSLPWLGALVPILAALVYLQPALAERWALAGLPTPAPGSPNVLLIVLDAGRAANLSANGYERPTTPGLERLAAGGARFERAIATAPWTSPSHASMFTGHFPHRLSAGWGTSLDVAHRTLAEELGARGWAPAGFVGNTFYATREAGLARGFARYDDQIQPTVKGILLGSAAARVAARAVLRAARQRPALNRKSASQINAAFLRWLDRRGADRPFFVFINYYDAHAPYHPPAPFDSRFQPSSPSRVERLVAAYDGALAYLDHEIRGLFAELERRGRLANTLVIVTGDHGEEFGEHAVFEHGHSLYLPALNVPLIMTLQGRVPPSVVSEPVSLRDLPATVFDVLGLEGSPFPGMSLAELWTGDGPAGPAPRPVLSEVQQALDAPPEAPTRRGDMRSLVLGGLHYIRNGDGAEELYDHVRDPVERNNLAPLQSADLDRLRAVLDSLLSGATSPVNPTSR